MNLKKRLLSVPASRWMIIGGYVGWLVLSLLISGAISVLPDPGRWVVTVILLLPGLAAVGLFLRYRISNHHRSRWLAGFLAIGILMVWLYLFSIAGPDPAIQFLDSYSIYFCLFGCLFFIGACFLFPAFDQISTFRLKLLLDLTISSTSLAVTFWLLYISPLRFGNLPDLRDANFMPVILFLIVDMVLLNLWLLTREKYLRTILGWVLLGSVMITLSEAIRVYSFQISVPLSIIGDSWGMAAWAAAGLVVCTQRGDDQPDENTLFILTGAAIPERIQATLPLALPLVMVGELFIIWQSNRNISSPILMICAMVWLLLIAKLGVSAGEFELQQYSLLFHNSAEPSFLCGHRLNLLVVNPAFQKVTGGRFPTDLVGKNLSKFLQDLPVIRRSAREIRFETRLLALTGREIPVDVSLQVIELGFFSRRLITGAIHDLSAQKEQQDQLQRAYEHVSRIQSELQQLNEDLEMRVAEKTRSLSQAYMQLEEQNTRLQSLDLMKSDFVSLVSHELRAPLTNISGGIELVLSNRKPLPESTRESLEMVQTEIKRLTRLVESILDLSVLDAGKMPLYPEPIRLPEMEADLRRHYFSVPGSDRIHWRFAPTLPAVSADRQALMSVFLHVIDNALKYAPEGEIVISAGEEDGRVVCSVSDHGAGIPQEVLDQIFDQFFRVENSDARVIYGHGLGLYMARKMLQAMGGDIRGVNRPEGGAQFEFWVPAAGCDDE